MENAVIDLGNPEATAGTISVCLSQAEPLVDLLVETMALDRLSKLGENLTSSLRFVNRSTSKPWQLLHLVDKQNGESGVVSCFVVGYV